MGAIKIVKNCKRLKILNLCTIMDIIKMVIKYKHLYWNRYVKI